MKKAAERVARSFFRMANRKDGAIHRLSDKANQGETALPNRRNLFFDGASGAALDEVLGERHIQRDDGHRHEHGARREDGELAVVKRIEPDGDRPRGLIDEQHTRQHEVRPRPYEGSECRIDDHRLGKRQRDGDKHAEIARAVQCGGIVNGARDGVEEPLLHQESHRSAAAV